MSFDYTIFYVLMGSMIVGALSGLMSAFIVFRGRSLIGDVIAHTALPGIVVAFLLFDSKEIYILLVGALGSSFFALWLIHQISFHRRVKLDASFSLILSVFFGFGVLLLSYVQKLEKLDQAGLQIFLFGQASSLIRADFFLMLQVFLFVSFCIILFWKEWKLLSFDPEYMLMQKFPVAWMKFFLDGLLVLAIVVGLKSVGVVLMAAIVIAPAAAARQWSSSFLFIVCLAILFGSLAGISGALVSSFWENTPTGSVIIFFLTFLVVFSVFFAPRRGFLQKWLQIQKKKNLFLMEIALKNFYALSLQHKDSYHSHSVKVIEKMTEIHSLKKEMQAMKSLGWVEQIDDFHWRLTKKGLKIVQNNANF